MFFFSFIFISITLFGRIYLLILKYFNDLIPLSFSHGLQDYISNITWLGFRSSMASLMHYILDPSLLPEPAQILSAQKSTSFLSFIHFLSSNSMWFDISFMTAIFSYSSFFGLYVCTCSVAQSHPTLCDLMKGLCPCDFPERILEWVDISSSSGSARPRNQIHVSCISCFGRRILYQRTTW